MKLDFYRLFGSFILCRTFFVYVMTKLPISKELRDVGKKHQGTSHSEGPKMSMRKAIKQIALDYNKDELAVSSDDATEDTARGVGPRATAQSPHRIELLIGSNTHAAEIDDDNNDNIDSDDDMPMRDLKPLGHGTQPDIGDNQSSSRIFDTASAQVSRISRSSVSPTNVDHDRFSEGSLYQTEDTISDRQHLLIDNATGIGQTSRTSLRQTMNSVFGGRHHQHTKEEGGALSTSAADLVGELKRKVNHKDEQLDKYAADLSEARHRMEMAQEDARAAWNAVNATIHDERQRAEEQLADQQCQLLAHLDEEKRKFDDALQAERCRHEDDKRTNCLEAQRCQREADNKMADIRKQHELDLRNERGLRAEADAEAAHNQALVV